MKQNLLKLFFFSFIVVFSPLNGEEVFTNSSCEFGVDYFSSLKMTTYTSRDRDTCSIHIGLRHPDQSNWRLHGFTTEGLYQVFNNYGYGPASQDVGITTFWLFPRGLEVNYQKNAETDTLLINFSNAKFYFNGSTALIEDTEGLKLEEIPEVIHANKGGVFIDQVEGIILKNGFSMGSAPYEKPRAHSIFIDRDGIECKITNNEVFDYEYSIDGTNQLALEEVYFKFPLDHHGKEQKLREFLASRCPQLNLTPLL